MAISDIRRDAVFCEIRIYNNRWTRVVLSEKRKREESSPEGSAG